MSPTEHRSAAPGPEPAPERLGLGVWGWLGLGLVCTALGLFVGARDFHVRRASAALAETFSTAAAQAAAAAHSGGRLPGLLSRVAVIRRTDRLTGTDPDAVLARAQHAVQAGDLYLATCDIAALPPASRRAMSTWREGAERKLARQSVVRIPGASVTP